MKILHLTLKSRWFDLIATGQKQVEFRELKPYWITRLYEKGGVTPRKFDEIHFKNGPGPTVPFMRVKFKGLHVARKKDCKPRYGEDLPEHVIVIQLGKVLEVRD